MLGEVQSMVTIVGGIFVVIVLLYILGMVHKQQKRIRDLEAHMNLKQQLEEEKEIENGKTSIL